MSASRQPQPPQTPVRPSRSIAPLIPGHPEIKLSKPLIGDPQPPANLQFGPCTFPVGAVGNIRKYREIQIQTNVMASVRRVSTLHFDLLLNLLDRRIDRILVAPGTTYSQLTYIALSSGYSDPLRKWKPSGTP